jgi:hypothetical protein
MNDPQSGFGSVLFLILSAALVAGALVAVAWPVLRRGRGEAAETSVTASSVEELDELQARRDAAYQALRELSFDRRMGKISEEDFAFFETGLKNHAAGTLRALDAWEEGSDGVLRTTGAAARIESRRVALAGGVTCPACGNRSISGDRFCGACGADLSLAPPAQDLDSAACPACGRARGPGDRFCATCGIAFPVAA